MLTLLMTAAAARYAYFPGDVGVTHLLQSISGDHIGWARAVTNTARLPWSLLLAALAAVVSYVTGGWRAALLAVVCFAALLIVGPWLQAFIARPRPAPSLVHVAGPSSGYSFPSIFALTYGSTFGYVAVLAWRLKRGWRRSLVALLCGLALLVGGSARVVLGAHWPSDVLVSYLIALVLAALLVRFIPARHVTSYTRVNYSFQEND